MKLIVVNWLRFYAIVSILIWHCIICPATGWNLLPASNYTSIIDFIGKVFIPEANMPLFTALSGYLFAYLFYQKKKSYASFHAIFKNKFKRLVIPFLVLGSLATLIVPGRPFVSGMIWGDGSSLWFCMMLFWCTLFRSGALLYNKSKNNIIGGDRLKSI